ncbi:MAG TPA: DUF998 domain-containing protein [Propionibacteriaceae bacterium]|nr:DUF998 domain-containing protein [Propionibacteriaceae bacterium]
MAASTTDAHVKAKPLRRAGVFAGLVAGPFFLVSVGLNTWASLGYLHQLGWEFVGGEQVPWPSSLARGPYGWAQVATFVITGLLIVVLAVAVRDQLPRRRVSGFAVVLLALLGVALILAAFRVDVPMLTGGSPTTWHGWVHGIAFLLIIAIGVLAPLTMALAVRGDAGWRPIAVASVGAGALFVVFLLLPWGNVSFLMAIVTLFAWIAAIAVRLATYQQPQQDQQAT